MRVNFFTPTIYVFRGTIVDNSAWNSSRIGLVGRLMASPEEAAAKMMHQLEADYILVVFGGFNGLPSCPFQTLLFDPIGPYLYDRLFVLQHLYCILNDELQHSCT